MTDKRYVHPRLEELDAPTPPSRFLSNGRLIVHITGAGTGLTSYSGYNLTRWQGDRVEDRDGFFVYLRDLDSRRAWSLTYQPTCLASANREVVWHPGVFEIIGEFDGIEARMEICVPSNVDADLRRITLRNRTAIARRIEVTTFAEVALNLPGAHEAHPGFSRLFVETEFVQDRRMILVRRRPRSNAESHPWMFHGFLSELNVEYETDRGRFLGRGRDASNPRAMSVAEPLSGSTGNILDPAVILRGVIALGPGASGGCAIALGAADDRDQAMVSLDNLRGPRGVEEAFEGAKLHEDGLLSRSGLNHESAAYYQALAGAILYGDPALRADPDIIARAKGSLGSLGRSADRRLVVLHTEQRGGARLLPEVRRAHDYWQALGLPIDLLVLVEDPSAPATIEEAVSEGNASQRLRTTDLSPATLDRIDAAAHFSIRNGMPDLTPALGGEVMSP